jgi:hypothetical protein
VYYDEHEIVSTSELHAHAANIATDQWFGLWASATEKKEFQ